MFFPRKREEGYYGERGGTEDAHSNTTQRRAIQIGLYRKRTSAAAEMSLMGERRDDHHRHSGHNEELGGSEGGRRRKESINLVDQNNASVDDDTFGE